MIGCAGHMHQASTDRFSLDEEALLIACKRVGTAGISVLHVGRANFARTYSTAFCELVADLILLYQNHAVPDPIARLSAALCARDISSCRGAEMTCERVTFLVDHHVARLPKTTGFRVLHLLTKRQCPVCGKFKRNVEQHINDAHAAIVNTERSSRGRSF